MDKYLSQAELLRLIQAFETGSTKYYHGNVRSDVALSLREVLALRETIDEIKDIL